MVVVIEIPTVIQNVPIEKILTRLCEKVERERPGENIIILIYCERNINFNFLKNSKCRDICWVPIKSELEKRGFKVFEDYPQFTSKLCNEEKLALVYVTNLTDYEMLLKTRVENFHHIDYFYRKELGQGITLIYIVYENDLGTHAWNKGTMLLATCSHYKIQAVTIPKSPLDKNWESSRHKPEVYSDNVEIKDLREESEKRRENEKIVSYFIRLLVDDEEAQKVADKASANIEDLRKVMTDYICSRGRAPVYDSDERKHLVNVHRVLTSILGIGGKKLLEMLSEQSNRDLKELVLSYRYLTVPYSSYMEEAENRLQDEMCNTVFSKYLPLNVKLLLESILSKLPHEILQWPEELKAKLCLHIACLHIAFGDMVMRQELKDIDLKRLNEIEEEEIDRFKKINLNMLEKVKEARKLEKSVEEWRLELWKRLRAKT